MSNAFTSLFQFIEIPVTIFSSDDVGALALDSSPGSLKNVLKQCLVDGIGDKAGLGWEMTYESADLLSAAFKSTDPTASGYVFKIDNSGTTNALLSAYQSMDDIDTGMNPLREGNEYALKASQWRLVGHGKAFIFVVDVTVDSQQVALPIIAGDLPQQITRSASVFGLWNGRYSTNNSGGLQTTLFGRPEGYAAANNSSATLQYSYPFSINLGAGGTYLASNACKFSYDSELQSAIIWDPIISALDDSTMTFLPMIFPMSTPADDIANFGALGANAIKVQTGAVQSFANLSCAIPTDFWLG